MFCPGCGAESKDTAKFCILCGQPLAAPVPTTRGRTRGRLVLGLGTLLVLIVAGALVAYPRLVAPARKTVPTSEPTRVRNTPTPSPAATVVTGPEGVRLAFAPEAAIDVSDLTVSQVVDGPPPGDDMVLASAVFEITGTEAILSSPAKLTLPVTPEALAQRDERSMLVVAWWDGAQWLPIGGKVDEWQQSISVETQHLSLFAAFRLLLCEPVQETDHFEIIPWRCPEGYSIGDLGQKLEDAWKLVIPDLQYETPRQVEKGQTIEVWIVQMEEPGEIKAGYWERLIPGYLNYSMYVNRALQQSQVAYTAVHEFFHIVQVNSYLHPRVALLERDLGPVHWWMEATATWMGAKVWGAQGYVIYQKYFQKWAESFLASSLDSGHESQMYRAGAFARYLEEEHKPDVIRESWAKLTANRAPLRAIDQALRDVGTSLAEAYWGFALQYGYLRDPDWLQRTMNLSSHTPEPRAVSLQLGTAQQRRMVQRPHLSGQVLELLPAGQGTLALRFDWGAHSDVWRVQLFVERRDGSVESFEIVSPQREIELLQFGAEVKRVIVVAANTSLDQNDASLGINLQLLVPTPTPVPTFTPTATPTTVPTVATTGEIAFVSDRDGNAEIYLMNRDGTGLTNLTDHPAEDRSPTWSRDGEQLAFVSDRSGVSQVFVMDADGTRVRQITNLEAGCYAPVWSPDGRRIAFTSVVGFLEALHVYWVYSDGTGLTEVYGRQPGDGGRTTWSPDGQRILFDANVDGDFKLAIVNLDGSELRAWADSEGWDLDPAWSPNGQHVAFVSDRWEGRVRIWVANHDGSDARNVTVPIGSPYSPVWSPDSRWIAFGSDGYGFYKVRPDGSALTQLADRAYVDFGSQWSWAPDSARLAFAGPNEGNRDIYLVENDGGDLTNLTSNPAQDSDPVWRPVAKPRARTLAFLLDSDLWTIKDDGTALTRLTAAGTVSAFAWSPDGREIAYLSGDSSGMDLYIVDAAGSNIRQLTYQARAIGRTLDWHDTRVAFLELTDQRSACRAVYMDLADPGKTIGVSPEFKIDGIGSSILRDPRVRWSPNGRWIAVSHVFAMGVAAADGSSFHQVHLLHPAWKSDSSHILHTSWDPPGGIRTLDPQTHTQAQLSNVSANFAVYSPDRRLVAYADNSQLNLMNADGTGHRTLVNGRAADLAWSPDGDRIAYASWSEDAQFGPLHLETLFYTGLHVARTDGSGHLELVAGFAHDPAWQPFTVIAAPDIGPEAVWNGDYREFQGCPGASSSRLECVVSMMRDTGASPQAIEFTKLFQGEAFMRSFAEYGVVDLAEIMYPCRANSNFQYVLVNGTPQIVHVERVRDPDITQDPAYPALVQEYPSLTIWGGDSKFEAMERLPGDRQRFIFAYALVDGCHACRTDSSAFVAFDFDDTGRFLGTALLRLR